VIVLTVRPWFSETRRAADARADVRGAPALLNRNSVILTILSVMGGLLLFAGVVTRVLNRAYAKAGIGYFAWLEGSTASKRVLDVAIYLGASLAVVGAVLFLVGH